VLSVVVVTSRWREDVCRCVDAIDAGLASAPEAELVVVMNGASVGVGEEPVSSRAVVIDLPDNLGFSSGVGQALALCRGEWVCLVNDDCLVEPTVFTELLAVGGSSLDIGSVAAQVRFAREPRRINSAGLEVDELGIAYERELGITTEAASEIPMEVFGATGTLVLYRRAMLDDVGGFDPTFFAYLEDADVAWRARARGWRSMYAPAAVGYHEVSATLGHASPEKHYLVGRNRVRMLAKNATQGQLRRRILAIVAYDLAYVLFVAFRYRTTAALRGRIRGLAEWRSYRRIGAPFRGDVRLARPQGFRAAIRRNQAYREGASR